MTKKKQQIKLVFKVNRLFFLYDKNYPFHALISFYTPLNTSFSVGVGGDQLHEIE